MVIRDAKRDSLIGRSVPRVEDRPLLSGQGSFLDDLELPSPLHVVFVRSQVAHGVIREIDVEEARCAPGIVAVYTAADLVDLPDLVTPLEAGIFSPPRPLLARDRVRFVGEPVAVVVAESPYLGEDAAALVSVEIDPLPVVHDIAGALDAASPPLHEQAGDEGNVVFERLICNGDPDAAFAAAAHVIERTFHHPRLTAAPMEPRGAAAYREDGGVTIWCSTQFPHNLRRIARELFGIEQVRVRCPDIGGGFGMKGVNYPEELLTAWLALRLDRPVKWVEDRVENLLSSTHAREMDVQVRAAADAAGTLLALDVDAVCDTGAYGTYPLGHILEVLGVAGMAPGPYRLRNLRARVRSVSTNKCPSGAYRGVGLPVATFVHERVMDVLASETGIDRAELRRRNMVTAGEMPYTSITNQRYDSGDYPAALATALELIGYDTWEADKRAAAERGQLIGLGISSYVEWTGTNSKMFQARGMSAVNGFDGCHMELDQDGLLTLWTTLPSIGQGTATTFAQLAAETIGVEFTGVRVVQSDTGASEIDGTGTGASRSANIGAGAIQLAGTELRQRLLDDAAERLEMAVADLALDEGVVTARGVPAVTLSVAELAKAADPERYRVSREFDPEHVLFAYATHACRVSVDPETGGITVLDYVVAEDCGRVVNPAIVEGQTQGAIAQGIGGAIYEDLHYDDAGQPQSASFMDYLLPTACEVPHARIHHMELPVPDSATGSKGMAEGGTVAAPAALANAVSDALGAEFNSLPLTPERLWSAARARPQRVG
ncbi:xanthine dehydrogenase family protein molybdopterin-binding subunit [Amycolatopsis rubida]|uniref:Xanthine dehydrogenase family protein molybdopterin-binding subunit n=1 Tax=Amycolatopsis rubida TaxID=112413 RepID=A0ABX0BZZ9_9PSEU|nr:MULTISPECIES: xanthine dehydrogenase family protein molybdopterin-binding subunit [Amycolatopsis]MYW96171.1 molybdopterin-dependent oxidoreductase [Amycolatopsis rubida]NEC61162.1 xanthine dehydrogenase family protein molybdopterin-binding subunit [Amycolatopsis rubida]OAP24313.1 Caffeine dehydrogenase subunit alpha [Amycolatopsis sp. M39]